MTGIAESALRIGVVAVVGSIIGATLIGARSLCGRTLGPAIGAAVLSTSGSGVAT